jgi:long-chain acyl-CoA synthetase
MAGVESPEVRGAQAGRYWLASVLSRQRRELPLCTDSREEGFLLKQYSQFHVDESQPWLQPEAGWPPEVSKNLDFPRITLYELFSQAVEKYRDRPAIWFLNSFMSYGELSGHVDALASGFHRLGLRKGDVVALALPSCFQYVIAYYACAKLGLIVTGVNPTYKPAEVLHELQLTGARTLVILDALYGTLQAPIAEKHRVDHLIVTNIADLLKVSSLKKWLGKKLKKIPTGRVPAGAISFRDLLRAEPIDAETRVSADDIATYIMTGGTTGIPKAAILTHFNCVSNAIQVEKWIWMKEPGACMVGILPLFHSFGMTAVMNTVLHAGMFMMLFPRPPETEDMLKTICEIGADNQTYFPGAEVIFQRIADFPEISKYPIAKKLRGCISGAGPLHKNVKDRFIAATSALLVEGYGLSEASPVVSGGPLGDIQTTGTIGLPLPGIQWKIMDIETGTKECPAGENGELVVTGPTVMQGYLGNPEETRITIREMDGKQWLYTGDIGFRDENGRVTLNDRKKQLIKVKGYSVFPTAVEELMGANDCVQEVAVAGLPDEQTGEAIKAWVVLKPEWQGKITEAELKEWAKENITHYKVPKHIEFIEEIPKTLVGKVMRRLLQEADPIYKAYHENK